MPAVQVSYIAEGGNSFGGILPRRGVRMMFRGLSLLAGLTIAGAAVAQTTTPAPSTPTPPSTPTFIPRAVPPRTLQPDPFRYSSVPVDAIFAQSKRSEQTYQLVQDFGRCATHVGPKRARALLDTDPNTRTELIELRWLVGVSRGCLPYGYQAPVVFLRGGLAEALYRREGAGETLSLGATTPATFASFEAAEARRSWARLPMDRDYTRLSNCLVVRAPAVVRAVLDSEHGSAAESDALDRVMAAAPGCSTSTRFPASASRSFVRAYLAESAYRWTSFTRAGQS